MIRLRRFKSTVIKIVIITDNGISLWDQEQSPFSWIYVEKSYMSIVEENNWLLYFLHE